MTAPTVPPITEEDIAQFLVNTPGFFERHAEVLTGVQLTSPHGARAVSLQERQAEMLRDKIKGLEQRIMDMVRHSHDNAAIAHKVHQWSCALGAVRVRQNLPQVVIDGLREHFNVPQAAVRVWDVAEPYRGEPFAKGVSEDARTFASSLTMPFCGPNMGFEPTGWLPDAASVQSLALLPLREGAISAETPAFGLLVLGSPDPQRFDANMATDFIARMAELASAALSRLRP